MEDKDLQEAGKRGCCYCGKKPDGAMLTMGSQMAHADCVIRKLNELLDPDWEVGDTREPDKIIGILAGYVVLADDQSLPIRFLHPNDKPNTSYRLSQQDMLNQGWRRIKLEVKDGQD